MLRLKNSKYKLLILILITGILLSIIPSNNAAILFNSPKKNSVIQEFTKNKDKGNYKHNQLIVKIDDNNYEKLKEKYDVEINKLSEDTYTVSYDNKDYSIDQMMTLLNEDNIVEYAEPNYVFSVAASMTTEPLYGQQWGLNDSDYGINIAPIWNDITDQNEIVVAVVDTGFNYNHQDLMNRMWINTDEVQGNGLDDDHNGYIDDYNGWNFSASTNNVMDNEGHGSHVSGIIGAGINNRGVAGIVPNVKIMALKVTNDGDNIYLDDIIEAIHYATSNGVKIFNFSFGSTDYIQSFYDLLEETNALFVCAAGNGDTDQIGDNNDVYPFYPASYNLNNIISVAALNDSGNLTSFSNYGQTSVDLAAPGSGILSTYLSNNYYYMDGTSMATPFVTGAAAILYSENPTINMSELKTYLLDGVKKIPSLSTKVSTSGILNVTGSYNLLKDIVPFDGGDGTTSNPYLISNAKQLNAIRNDLDASYKLTANIDLKYDGINQDIYPDTIGWLPIGTYAEPFTGTLDGAGYKITNLTINRPDMSYVGLFGYVVGSGVLNPNISNLEISANNIAGKDYVGTLSGYGTNTYLKNITITASISSNNPFIGYIGGVIGYLQNGLIKESYVAGTINTNANYVGGISGYIEGNINLCYNESNILGNSNVGGLTGYILGNISNVFNYGGINEGIDSSNIGGIAGTLNGQLTNSYYLGMLYLSPSILDNTIGMIVGNNLGTVTNSYYFNPYHLTNNNSGVELSKDQLFDNSNYSGFDFTNTWEMKAGILLPLLKNMNFISLTSFNVPSTLDVNINAVINQIIGITKNPLTNLRNTYLFNSSDENVVKVTANGQIIPVSLGTTTVSVYSIELNTTMNITITVKDMVKGDLNNDKNVTTTDLVILRRYLAGIEMLNDDSQKNADINDDTTISLTDLVKLRRFLAGLEDL